MQSKPTKNQNNDMFDLLGSAEEKPLDLSYLYEIRDALLAAPEYACDIESTGFSLEDDKITMISFAVKGRGWALRMTEYSLELIKQVFAEVFADKSKIVIFHNAGFDVKFLNSVGIFFNNKIHDTMILAWLYDEDRIRYGSYGLKECVLKEFNYQMATFAESTGLFGNMDEYSADDSIQTLRLYEFYKQKLIIVGVWDWYSNVEYKVTEVIIEMETRGVALDKAQLKSLKEEAFKQVDEIAKDLYNLAGYEFDIGSSQQTGKLLFDELKLGAVDGGVNRYSFKNELSKEWSTKNEVLEAMHRDGIKIASRLLDYREINTRLNVFIKPLYERCRTKSIIYPRFIQTGTVSGRLSSKDPNYQNLPRKGGVRKAFVCRKGYKILRADYSQAELRLIAHMSGDSTMLYIYKNGGDIHKMTAEACKISRQAAKACVAGESLVLTEHGFLRIDELIQGPDEQPLVIGIVSEDGVIRKTESSYSPGIQPVVEVNLEYGLKLTVTPDHEFMIMENGKIIRRRADQLAAGDPCAIIIGKNVHGNNLDLPIVEIEAVTSFKDMNLPTKLDSRIARFLGYFVSEGHQSQNEESHGDYNISFGFSKELSADLIQDFERCIQSVVGDRYSVVNGSGDYIRFSISSKKLSKWMQVIGSGKISNQKNIPKCIRQAPWSLKREFLRAYFEVDGTNKAGCVSATSKSELLIRELHSELANIGILGFIHSELRNTDKGKLLYWVWSIRRYSDLQKFEKEIGFISETKQAALRKNFLTCKKNEKGNLYLDGVQPLLEEIWSKVKRQKKDKLREVIRRSDNKIRFNDTRLKLLQEEAPEALKNYQRIGIWTAKVRSVIPAGEAPVFDLYEPEKTAMVIGCNIVADCNFGLIYRMSAARLQGQLALEGISISIEEAQQYVRKYFQTYSKIREYHQRVEKTVKHRLTQDGFGWVRTLGGRLRRLDREFLENPETSYAAITQAINTTIQGGVSDLIKVAMVDMQEEFKKRGWLNPSLGIWDVYLQGQVHDEVFIECKEEYVEEASRIVEYCMVNAGVKYKIKVPMISDVMAVDHLGKG